MRLRKHRIFPPERRLESAESAEPDEPDSGGGCGDGSSATVVFFVQVTGVRVERSDHTVSVDVIVYAPPRTPPEVSESLRPELPEILAQQIENLVDPEVEAVLVEPVWAVAVRGWAVTDYGHFDAAATLLDQTRDTAHSLVGRAVGVVAKPAGPKVAGVAAALGQGAPLPIDRPLNLLSNFLRIGAAVVGIAFGHPALAIKSVQSLVHSEVTKMVEKAVGRMVEGALQPEPASNRDPRPEPPTPVERAPDEPPILIDISAPRDAPGVSNPRRGGVDRFGGFGIGGF